MPELYLVGKPVPRIDGPVKATGQAIYAADLSLPGMLYGKILRSSYAHAKILNVDFGPALKLPGVRGIITGKDFPGIPYGHMPFTRDQLPMAVDKVRHYGEAVAAVAAIDEDIAEEALELIRVDYEELPVILTAEEALAEGAPLVHEKAKDNIAFQCHYHWGDVEKGFNESDYVRQERFTSQHATTGFIEPHAILASVDISGRITLQGSKQSPYITWRHFCRAMDLPLSKVRMITPYVGGGFSGKHEPFDLDFAAARLAQKTGRPVKIVLNQDEILGTMKRRQAKDAWLKLGLKKDGTLVAGDCRLIAEGGAYCYQSAFQCWIFGTFMNVPYRLPNLRFEALRVYTNQPPSGTVFGHGVVPARFVFESMLDIVADDLGIDKLEIRLRNTLRDYETTANNMPLDKVTMTECLERVSQAINWESSRRQRKRYQGIGFSGCLLPSGARMGAHFASSALVKVVEDGTVSVIQGCTELGQGCDTVMAQITAEVLGLGLEDVRIGVEDTDDTVLEAGMFGARGTPFGGAAVKKAAEDARQQLAQGVAEALQVKAEDLVFCNREIYVAGDPKKKMNFLEAVRIAYYRRGEPIYGRGYFTMPGVEVHDLVGGGGGFGQGFGAVAHAIEVEVDPGTGKVKITRSALGHDAGRPINPLLMEGQEQGSVSHGLGVTLYEENLMDSNGQPLNVSFLDYKIPTAKDVPDQAISFHIINEHPQGPFGAKGGAEAAVCTGPGAIANAIADAIGVRLKELPFTPDKILAFLSSTSKRGLEE